MGYNYARTVYKLEVTMTLELSWSLFIYLVRNANLKNACSLIYY